MADGKFQRLEELSIGVLIFITRFGPMLLGQTKRVVPCSAQAMFPSSWRIS